MRTTTAPELAVLAANTRTVTLRVKVANGSGTMIDYSSYVESVSIDHDVDQPVGGCTITFTRASGTLASLAPLRTDSTLNVNDVAAYAPALDLNRSVTVEVATTAVGATIAGGDYKLMFKGTVDVVNFERSPVSIICRDLGAPLVDRWIEAEATYGTGVAGSGVGGRAVELVMQDVLDAVFGAGVYPIYTPVSPAWDINTFRQQRMSVMDALQDLMQGRGLDIRYRWDDGTSAFRLTLTEPPRAKTTPDYTFAPSTYFDIASLNIDKTTIRNAIEGNFRNANNLGNRKSITVTDSASITKYGRLYFYIQEPDVSPIDSDAEMTAMLTPALADLKEPKAEQEVDMPFFWPADISDLYRYSANGVHYNTNQDIAVVEYTHELSPGHHRTRVKVRGTPIGQYATWLGRGGTGPSGGGGTGGQAFAPYAFIAPRNTEANDNTWDLRFNALNGSGGGGANISYTIKSKKTFGVETTLFGPAAGSTLPKDLTVTRDLNQDQVITFTVTDAATALFSIDKFTLPAFQVFVNPSGNLVDPAGNVMIDLSAGAQTKTLIISSSAFQPITNGLTYTHSQNGLFGTSGDQNFIAFAPLPQGVTITKLGMLSQALPAGGTDIVLKLYRQDSASYGAGVLIATATRVAVNSDAGGTDESSVVSEAVTTNTYLLQLTMGGVLKNIVNATVHYTMPSYDKTI